ncbi:probable receptor-like serine/threonine-protein kinase At5g57670 isoform X3 [Olea europaea var. sylvestris]|uniref:Probable receptor-like serine threonine- kinase At5g57670 isoform X1 n=1 Tax=Olea europaea subsp. europaea TaxID=158383 RepID=A0A8S0RY32_OLEEU|nr:probable receptor-like serine/threonine-protein kinase At5g57670 isoform X3 [Olea europaea var. sylvestris]CAA2983930.1 probable receptor-like serine threonine- kinase At5g57670 isoform X1 [Olea europaea subsp. europaea]
MTMERLGKIVVVGIKFDGHTKELMDWAVVKVADPADCVIAIHVCRNSDSISREKALLDDYLEDYKALCNQKQVALSAEVLKGNSIRKALVIEAKNHSASAVIVGITKFSALGGWSSIAKYCARRLPSTTEVMAVHNGKVVFSRNSTSQPEGPRKDPKPRFYLTGNSTFKDTLSEFGESEISEMGRLSYDGILTSKDEVFSTVGRHKKGSLSSISLPAEDFTRQRPGWPLLQTASSITQPSIEARNMSVVKWVMNLPSRSLLEISESKSTQEKMGDVFGIENQNFTATGKVEKIYSLKGLPQELELILKTNPHSCKWFCYDVLRMSASHFSAANLIGQGGCNSVYKGLLPDGKQVAIKILRSSKEAWKDFMLEVDIMTTLKHQRIVPLLGICVECTNLISVYDFFSKGNLEENLHGNRKEKAVLQWEVRFKIAVGIAEALNYLHNECPRPVIHRDFKSSNILLTDELEPQLCDFGLAIWGPKSASFLTDRDVVGTFGYLAPEYFMYGKVSDKIDVYAFGVVLLELLSGRKPIVLETPKGQESLVMWAKPRLESGDLKSILDPNLEGDIDEDQMQRMALAATLCLKQAARLRPKMSQILGILTGEKCVNEELKSQYGNHNDLENLDDNDDEVYPDSSAESHLSLAFLDVNDNSTSFSSMEQSSPLSVEEYLRKRCSRSSSLD